MFPSKDLWNAHRTLPSRLKSAVRARGNYSLSDDCVHSINAGLTMVVYISYFGRVKPYARRIKIINKKEILFSECDAPR
jgi:hypothetical protein